MGLFVVFEGVEGSGKTTQSKKLSERISIAGHTVVSVHEPGSTPIGEDIRRLTKDVEQVSPLAELLLFSAARTEMVETLVRPALNRGNVVICDRYVYSTVAYQGYGRGVDLNTISHLNQMASGDVTADLVILLDLPTHQGLARKSMNEWDKFELENADFHIRVRDAYRNMAKADSSRWLVIDSTKTIADVAKIVWARVAQMLS